MRLLKVYSINILFLLATLIIIFTSCTKNTGFSKSLDEIESRRLMKEYGLKLIDDNIGITRYTKRFNSTREMESYLKHRSTISKMNISNQSHLVNRKSKKSAIEVGINNSFSSENTIYGEAENEKNSGDGIVAPLLFNFNSFISMGLPEIAAVYQVNPFTSSLMSNYLGGAVFNYTHESGGKAWINNWSYQGLYRESFIISDGIVYYMDWKFEMTFTPGGLGGSAFIAEASYTPLFDI